MSSLIGNGPQQVPTNGDLGTMAFQDKESVKIEGGTINGMAIGATTPAAGKFTTFSSTGASQLATSTGNVLIGTTTDDVVNKLQVNGGISSTDLTVTGGTVTLPSTTSIGNVSSTELGYLDGVTSAVQTQLNSKAALASPAFTGTPTAPTAATGTNTTQVATAALVKATGDTKALLAGSATQDFTAKTLTATTVNANNIGDIVQQQGIVTTYAASGSSGIQIANNDNLNFGTGDFTLVWKGSLPDWTPAIATTIISKYAGTSYLVLSVQTSGVIRLRGITPAGINWALDSASPLFIDGSVHTISCTVTRETAAVAGYASFYVDGNVIGTPSTIPAATPLSISNTGIEQISGLDTSRTAATTQAVYAFNRALSAAEVLSLYRYGVAESDKWGSQTAIYTSDFSAGVDGWVYSGDTQVITGNVDGIGGRDNCLSVRCTSTVSTYRYAVKNYAGVVIGKSYILSAEVYIPSTNVSVKGIGLGTGDSPFGTLKTTNVFDQWITLSGVKIATNATVSTAMLDTSGAVVFAATVNDIVYVRNYTAIPLGATLALEPEGIQPAPGQWLDSSSNKLHALQPATGSSLARKKENFEIRWTNTWAGTHEAQYVGGINQAVLPPNCYIESIIGVVTGTAIEDIILGDGVDTARWVAITTGLATGTQTFAIANRVSDGTNRKLVVDPDAAFTGSISWVIKGIIL